MIKAFFKSRYKKFSQQTWSNWKTFEVDFEYENAFLCYLKNCLSWKDNYEEHEIFLTKIDAPDSNWHCIDEACFNGM